MSGLNKEHCILRLLLTAIISTFVINFLPQSPQQSLAIISPDIRPKLAQRLTKTKFDPQNPKTWPKCSRNEIVRADTGKCAKRAKKPLKMAQSGSTTPNCEKYRPLVARYKWNLATAMAVMQAESGCRAVTPDNSNLNYDGVADHGLFQLHGIPVTDPAENIRIAYQVKYLNQGWGAWSVCNKGIVSC